VRAGSPRGEPTGPNAHEDTRDSQRSGESLRERHRGPYTAILRTISVASLRRGLESPRLVTPRVMSSPGAPARRLTRASARVPGGRGRAACPSAPHERPPDSRILAAPLRDPFPSLDGSHRVDRIIERRRSSRGPRGRGAPANPVGSAFSDAPRVARATDKSARAGLVSEKTSEDAHGVRCGLSDALQPRRRDLAPPVERLFLRGCPFVGCKRLLDPPAPLGELVARHGRNIGRTPQQAVKHAAVSARRTLFQVI
jgi:hypothetical protein